jgi:hypothetical protein
MVSWYGAPSLTRGRVCRLQLLVVLASAVLGSESRGAHDHILLSQIWDCLNQEGHISEFMYPRNRVAQLYPQELGSLFVVSYDSQGYCRGIRTRLHTGTNCSNYDTILHNFGTDLIGNMTSNIVLDCCGGSYLAIGQAMFKCIPSCCLATDM